MSANAGGRTGPANSHLMVKCMDGGSTIDTNKYTTQPQTVRFQQHRVQTATMRAQPARLQSGRRANAFSGRIPRNTITHRSSAIIKGPVPAFLKPDSRYRQQPRGSDSKTGFTTEKSSNNLISAKMMRPGSYNPSAKPHLLNNPSFVANNFNASLVGFENMRTSTIAYES